MTEPDFFENVHQIHICPERRENWNSYGQFSLDSDMAYYLRFSYPAIVAEIVGAVIDFLLVSILYSFVAQLYPTGLISLIDKSLCMVCQKSTKQEFAKTITISKIERVIKS